MKKNLTLEESFSFNLAIYRMMTASQKRIACAFCVMYRAFMCKNQKESFWGREKIARHAKCSIGEVSRFLKTYKKFIFDKVWQKRQKTMDGKVKYFPNRYEFNHRFFTLLWFLKKKGYVKYWHVQGEKLYNQSTENEIDTMFKIGYDFELINRECAHDSRLKTHTRVLGIPSESSIRRLVPTKEPTVPDIDRDFKKTASEAIKVPGLSVQCKAHLDRFGSLFLIHEINMDYDFNVKHGKRIRYPDQWVKSRLTEQMQHQYRVLKGKTDVRKMQR